MAACPSPGLAGRRRRPRLALLLAGSISALLFSLGACIVDERKYDEHLALCSEYCELVGQRCQGDYKVYDYPEQCMAVCQHMDPGGLSLGASDNKNTVTCRIEKLRQTEFDARPEQNCPQVGPGGAGYCGDDCDSFCALRQQVCSGVEGQTYEDDLLDPAKCKSNCLAVPKLSTFDAARDQKGDSLQCRLVHVSEAAVSAQKAATHCLHTQTVPKAAPTFPCSDDAELSADDNCAKYCSQVLNACQNEFAVYEDETQCQAVCKVLEPGEPGDTSENSVRCRRYHAYNALDEGPSSHCTHAGPTGDGHCGADNCESYCTILRNACPTQFQAQFPGDPAAGEQSCRTSCNPPSGTPAPAVALKGASANSFQTFQNGDKIVRYAVNPPPQGDNLLCRTYHAVKALAKAPDDPECAAAFGAAPCAP
ncbi:MAG TPA: hypothetical protein VFS67_16645 [Polyangiaceae bacterium]|jgi:hypothetical protein|nr:hypothetical protein [Polyangiaceae bacterium]